MRERLESFELYYQRELSRLHREGAEFARMHPKIAQHLDLGAVKSSDPHVERLLESFAFLTAGLNRNLDDLFPTFSQHLIDALYPQLTRIIPSLSIAYFRADPKKGNLSQNYHIPSGTTLSARINDIDVCSFQTQYDVSLVPWEVIEASVVARDSLEYLQNPQFRAQRVLRLRLRHLGGGTKETFIPHIRFYINGTRTLQNLIYEALFFEESQFCTVSEKGISHIGGKITPVGFAHNEAIIPDNGPSHPAYRLLMEYFAFPQKFMFFDIQDVTIGEHQDWCEVILRLPQNLSVGSLDITSSNFRLGCTPITNTFRKVSEPIYLDHKSLSYPLVADYRRSETTEIQSIESVYVVSNTKPIPVEVAPYLRFSYKDIKNNQSFFWIQDRLPSAHNKFSNEMRICFVDYNLQTQKVANQTAYANLICTNRQLASRIPHGAVLHSMINVPAEISCIEKPTSPIYPSLDGIKHWKLISHIAVNHLALLEANEDAGFLKEMLSLYADISQSKTPLEIESIISAKATTVARRLGKQAWKGFATGSQIQLTFQPEAFGSGGAILFGAVLNTFFSHCAAINSFIELNIRETNPNGVQKTWPIHHGASFLI